MRLFLGLVFALIPLAAACSGGGDDPDGGLSASSCGVAAEAAAAECAGLEQCGAGAQNYAVDPTCEHCPGRADSQLCEAGACRDVSGLELNMVCTKSDEKKLYTDFTLQVRLPADFPAKYKDSLLRAMDQCTVKRHFVEPPTVRSEVVD